MSSISPDALNRWIPVLDLASASETGSERNLDWPNGSHSSEVTSVAPVEDGTWSWRVEQQLEGAGGINRLLDEGKAVYVVEARCPHSAWCEFFVAEPGKSYVRIDAPENMTRGDIYLCPGVITIEQCSLETDDLHQILQPEDGLPIEVDPGCWLVFGRPTPVNASSKETMVLFEEDENLADRKMRISCITQSDDVRFQVWLSSHDYQQVIREEPMLRWGSHLAVFAMLPYTKDYEIRENDDGTPLVEGSRIGQRLANRLHAAGIDLWDTDSWDPARALTEDNFLLIPEQRKADDYEEDA